MRIFSFIIIFSISLSVSAIQDSLGVFKNNNWYISGQVTKGFLVAHRTSLGAISKDYTSSLLLEVGSKTFGKKAWQTLYNYPSLGVGYYRGSLSNDEILGKANALYGFIEVPYFTEKKWTITYKVGFGLAYLTKKFDLYNNIYNVAIGSHFNAFIHLSYDLKFNLMKEKMFVRTGVSLTHMSNSKTQTPNLGLNILDIHLALAYNITARRKVLPVKKYQPNKHFFACLLAGGVKEFNTPLLGKYPAGNITLEYEYALWKKSAFGLGFDLFYDGVIHKKMKLNKDEQPFKHAHRFGGHLSYTHYYGKVGFITQLGYYLKRYYQGDLPYYLRIGVRAKASKHLLVNLSMKTHLGRADILEIGLGYYFSK